MSNVVTLNGYTISFIGAFPEAGGTQTRFTYEVTGVDPAPPALDWFFLENACGSDPTALQPATAVGPAVVNGINGIKWNSSVPPGATRTYSYTFAGALDVRVARAVIQRGGTTAMAALPGPCGGHLVTGSVFVNADDDAGRSGTELGIGNVLVEVYDGTGLVSSDVTTAGGHFEFVLASGAYTLRVSTSGEGVFNTTLYGSYDFTGGTAPAEMSFVLDTDVSGKEFGFNPDKQQILTDLSEGGRYQTKAQDVRFWQRVIRDAARNRCTSDPYGGSDICPGEVALYLDAIFYSDGEGEGEYYLLSDPFLLTGSDAFAIAGDLLSRPTQTDVAKVSRNLFAMQLNLMKGWGTPDRSYDDALMSYLEEWVRANSAGARIGSGSTRTDEGANEAQGGGGGTVEEGITAAYLIGGGGGTVEE